MFSGGIEVEHWLKWVTVQCQISQIRSPYYILLLLALFIRMPFLNQKRSFLTLVNFKINESKNFRGLNYKKALGERYAHLTYKKR